MDWRECVSKRFAKEVSIDKNRIQSMKKTAERKIKAADVLPEDLYPIKITLLYDGLRSYLEAFALEKMYRIYNHECCTAFLKEVLGLSREGDIFDWLRRIRNGINYYGMEINFDESTKIISDLRLLVAKFRKMAASPTK